MEQRRGGGEEVRRRGPDHDQVLQQEREDIRVVGRRQREYDSHPRNVRMAERRTRNGALCDGRVNHSLETGRRRANTGQVHEGAQVLARAVQCGAPASSRVCAWYCHVGVRVLTCVCLRWELCADSVKSQESAPLTHPNPKGETGTCRPNTLGRFRPRVARRQRFPADRSACETAKWRATSL